ncbi:MAG: hydrogenase, partial [bacterium]|nr:hydrogenase [bacterium]
AGDRKSQPPVNERTSLDDGNILTAAELRDLEAANIRRALAQTNGKIYGVGGAGELLDMKPTTLASRVKRLGIK